jgi:hypothetical protein
MIKLNDLLNEHYVTQNRINMMRINTILEKLLPEISKADAKKVTKLFDEFNLLVTEMNSKPYTKFNIDEWVGIVLIANEKLDEIRNNMIEISKKKKNIDFVPLIKALNEVLGY